ncbi:hypothetical protein [Jiella mangrovi]|uniref:Transposase DDE domain-containing protein n=1 Tax=Jiella mangrovi TaxID=2821407 RepID=A0ABS4BCF4_9HYPH|nr:hypothetical protein [Jiella mangrovi]MBP0614439.1 hypothetical protein [Jiella mangrovi]
MRCVSSPTAFGDKASKGAAASQRFQGWRAAVAQICAVWSTLPYYLSRRAVIADALIVRMSQYQYVTYANRHAVLKPALERRASERTHKGRSNILNHRIVLSKNRFRFLGRCGSLRHE